MSEEKVEKLMEKMDIILSLNRAPSQRVVFFHLLGSGNESGRLAQVEFLGKPQIVVVVIPLSQARLRNRIP